MRQTVQRGLVSLLVTLVVTWPVVGAMAQQTAPSPGGAGVGQDAATTQPSQPTDADRAIERLQRLREEMQRQQAEKAAAKPSESGPTATVPAGQTQPAAPPTPASKPRPSIAELRERAAASTQRIATQPAPPSSAGSVTGVAEDVPDDFVGPPLKLARFTSPRPEPGSTPATPVVPPPAVPAVTQAESAPTSQPADGRTEWFNFVKVPWEDVIMEFVKRIGKPLMQAEDLVIGGELTYVADRKFTKEEAIDELNLIMYEKGYRFVESEHHIRIIPINELRQWVPVKDTYNSIEAFDAANPRDMDVVVVYYQVTGQPAKFYVDMFFESLAEGTLMTALPDSNQIKIIGLARDVRKFVALKDRVNLTPEDPRILKIFKIKTNARNIEQLVRNFLKLNAPPAQQMQLVRDPRTGQMVPQQVGGGAAAASSDVLMVPDDRTNSIVVKAVEDQIKQIEKLIAEFDKDPGIGEFTTKVIPVQHANASEVATLLQSILQQEQVQMQMQMPNWQQQQQQMQQLQQLQQLQAQAAARRGGQPVPQPQPPQPGQMQVGMLPQDLTPESLYERAKKAVRMVADSRSNSLIVYATEEGFNRVEEMLKIIDQPLPDKFRTFKPQHAKVGDIAPMLTQIVTSALPPTGRSAPTITPDETNDVFYVMAERDELEKIEQLIDLLDVAPPEQERHVIELANLQPSKVATLIQTLLASPGGSAASRTQPQPQMPRFPRGMRGNVPFPTPNPTPTPSATKTDSFQVIALDEARLLIVYCTPEDWEKVEGTIRMWDERARTNTPQLETFTVTKGNPQTIAGMLSGMYRNYSHPALGSSAVTIQAEGDKIYVYAVQPAIEEIGARIKALDIETTAAKIEILPLVNADATQAAQQLQTMFGGGGRSMPRGLPGAPSGGTGPIIQAEAATNSLIVQADKGDMEQIKDAALRLDQRYAESATEPVAITPKYQDVSVLLQTIQTMFHGAGGRGGQDLQVSVAGSQLIIKAPKKQLAEIQALVAQLDVPDTAGAIQVKTYELKVLSALQVQAQVQMFLAQTKKPTRPGQLSPGAFAEPTTNTLVVLAPSDMLPMIDTIIQELEGKTPPSGKMQAYTLKNARADQMANNVDAMLKAKVIEKEGAKKGTIQTAVFSDAASNRLFVLAPDDYQKLAGDLIRMVDEETDSGEIVHIVPLNEGDAQQVALSLNQIALGKAVAGGKGPGGSVRISADSGSNTILIGGLPKDVADVEKWITELEGNSVRVPELQTFTLKYANSADVDKTLKNLFPPGKGAQDTVTITADEYSGKLVVTANKRKMRQVEKFIEELDRAPAPEEGGFLAGGKQMYFVEINRGDASDIAWDVRDQFPDEKKGGPSITADWYGEYITVKCRPAEFPGILKLIREYERRARLESKVVTFKPKGDPARALSYLQHRYKFQYTEATAKPPEETIVEDVWKDDEVPPAVKEKQEKAEQEKGGHGGGRVLPFEPGVPLSQALLDDLEADVTGAPAKASRPLQAVPVAAPVPAPSPRPTVPDTTLKVQLAALQPGMQPLPKPAATRPTVPAPVVAPAPVVVPPEKDAENYEDEHTVKSPLEKQEVQIAPGESGTLIFTGPKDKVDDIKSAMELLEEDLAVGEVIRIFHFKYGDVSAAAEILSMMFDVQQRQIVIPQPQQPQQQRGQQGRQGQQGGEEGREGQQGGIMDQLRGMVGGKQATAKAGAGGGQLRMATDPGHNYLIIKCQETALPEIRKLLRELDIPPGEVQVKVFQLKNLLADETAENIKDVLGISKVQQRRGGGRTTPTPQRPGQPGQPGGQQQQLMEMLQQQLVSVPGVEGGAKVERVEIVPNATTNSLMVSAPPEVMGLIQKVIDELEGLEGREVVGINYYPLKQARAEDILPLLQEIFDAAAGGSQGGRPGRGAGGMPRAAAGGSSPAALGSVSISADPRTNTIIYTAQSKDVPIVEHQIAALDIPGSISEAEMYICRYGDAESIASVLEATFVAGGGRTRGNRAPGAAAGEAAGTEVRIVADSATNAILVWGPPDKRDLIFTKITELDRLNQRGIREIPVTYADPTKLADTLMEVFGSSGGGAAQPGRPSGRRTPRVPGATGGGGANVQSAGRVMILGDKDAKKLLVRAPDEVFKQIEDLAQTLDQPSEQLKLKRFALHYADAATVVDDLKQAMTEYMQIAKTTGQETDFDAFTAVPDPRTNSVMVVGSDKTFLFVSQVLASVDVETPSDQRKEFRVFLLERADAATVADAINGFATGGAAPGGGTRSSGRRSGGGGMPAGGGAGTARELNVFAVADEATNSVMVYGRGEDIDRVEESVIARLEESISDRFQIATMPVQNVPPSQIVGFIWQFIDTTAAGGNTNQPRGGGRGQATEGAGPQIVPNDAAKTLIVRGTKRQIAEVRDLVAKFDNKESIQDRYKIVQVPYGQDPGRLGSEVERVVNDSETADADRTGRPAARVTIGVDDYSRTLIVSGDLRLVAQVETIVKQLSEVHSEQPMTVVLDLQNLPASDAEKVVNDLQRKQGTGARSGGSARPTGGTRSSTGGTSTPRPSTPSIPRTPGGSSTPPRRSNPAPAPRPSGGGSPGGGARAPADVDGTLFGHAAVPPDTLLVQPAAWIAPYVAAAPISPLLDVLLARQLTGGAPPVDAAAPPQPTTTRPATKPATKPAAKTETKPVAKPDTKPASQPAPKAESKPLLKPAPKAEEGFKPLLPPRADLLKKAEKDVIGEPATSEPAELVEGLSGVSGALRGEVMASAIDDRKIIITGDASDVEFIQRILRMMDATKGPALIDVFSLKQGKAAVLAPIIDKAIKARLDAAGRKDRFSVNAEARSNSLIVSAPQDIMAEIDELVQRLDVEKPGGGNVVRTVELKHVRAADAVAILRPTIERYNTLNEIPKDAQSSVEPIDRNNSIMIIGTPADIDQIQSWFEAIDVEITADKEKKSFVRVDAILIQLKNGQAEDVAKVINDMIKAEQDAGQKTAGDTKTAGKAAVKSIKLHMPDGRELPELQLEYPIRLIPEKGTNSLIIFSTPDNNESLKAIVDVFDTLPVGADTDVKAFVLQYANADDVSKLLTDIFKDKSPLTRPVDGDVKTLQKGVLPPVPPGVAAKGLPYPLVVQSDPRSNTVVIVGRTDAVLLAAGLIRELDRPTMELGLKAYVLELKHTQAAQLADKLKKLLDDRSKAVKGDKNAARDSAVIQAEERSNALIVLATPEVYEMVEDLVLQLDAASKYSVVDIRYRQLKFGDAVKLQSILDEMFKAKKDAEKAMNKDATDTLTSMADARSNSLVLAGTRDYLDEAERLVGELDQQFEGTVIFRALKVKLNSAANIASLLKDMIDKALKQTDSKLKGTPINVSADPVSDTLLLAASREDMDVLERWVEILDRPSEVGRMTRIIPLQRAVAEDVAKAVTDIYKKQGGGSKTGEIDITVSSDKTSNSVVAFGSPALVADIEGFVRQYDTVEAQKGAIIRIFKLSQADAQEAGDLLGRILDLRSGAVGGTGGGGGSSGTSKQESAKQVLLIFQRLHPEIGMETLKAVRSDIVVISDLRTNSLIVAAPPDSMPLMESLVAAVDVPPEAARIRVFRLRNSDAEQMVKMLGDLFAQKSATTTSGGRTGGAAGEAERVLTLGEGGEGGGRQEIAFATDVRTNSVIAAGTPGYLDLVEQMVLELDTVPIQDREVLVYSPKNNKADIMVPSIKEFSDAEQKRLTDIGKDVSMGVKQERQITAIANKDANRIILSVDPRFKDTVMRVVNDLDQPPPQVLIQVLIVEVTMDNELDLGIEFAFQDLQWAKAGASSTSNFDYVGGTDIGAAGSGLGGFTFTITGADFNFLFRTLQNEGNLNVLSRPQIVAMDNQKAKIDISDDVPYVTGTQTSITGQISTSVNRTKVGITLEVTPQINPDGFVRLEIDQKVSDRTGSTVDVGPGVTSPIFFTREAQTTVMVEDNETVLLGGLITSRAENREQKVPLVGDIPALGLLFRNQSDTTRRTELLLVLTPHVIRSPEEYHEHSIVERDNHRLLPEDVLRDSLMQGLRLEPETPMKAEGAPVKPVSDENVAPVQESLEPKEEEYGPVRPALRVPPPGNPDSYDVPVTARVPAQP